MLGELSYEEIKDVLENNFVGRIGCSDGQKIYVVPISYLFKNDGVICHSRDGMKVRMMRINPNVCFEVDEIKNYENWRSVIAWGAYRELRGAEEAEARQFFSEVMLSQKASLTSLPPDSVAENQLNTKTIGDSVFYKITFSEVTGRFERDL